MGDRVVVMRKGQLQQVDIPQHLYESPVNLFVASFMGSPSMNFVQGRLEQRGEVSSASSASSASPSPARWRRAGRSSRSYVGRTLGDRHPLGARAGRRRRDRGAGRAPAARRGGDDGARWAPTCSPTSRSRPTRSSRPR